MTRTPAVPDEEIFHTFGFEDKRLVFEPGSMQIFEIDSATEELMRDMDSLPEIEKRIGKEKTGESLKKIAGLTRIAELSSRYDKELRHERERDISSLWLNISHICNMHCIYCFAGCGDYGKKKSLMEEKTAKEAVDFLFDSRKKGAKNRIVFFGGEPLLNFPVLKECVIYAEKKSRENGSKVSFYLITNGTLFNPEIISFVSEHKIGVQFSLDGPADVHDVLRKYTNGTGTYDTVYNNILLLAKEGSNPVAVRATITHYNCEISKIYQLLHRMGLGNIGITPVQAGEDDDFSLKPEDITKIKEEYNSIAGAILQSIKSNAQDIDLNCFSPYFLQLLRKRKTRYYCGSSFNFLTVTPDGRIYPCHRMISQGDYDMGSLSDGVIIPDSLKNFGALSVDDKLICSKCWAKYLCGGGCSASALYTSGQIETPDNTFCEINKAIIENALKIFYYLNVHFDTAGMEKPPAESM